MLHAQRERGVYTSEWSRCHFVVDSPFASLDAQQSPTQKNLDPEVATAYWRILLTGRFVLLDEWISFLKVSMNSGFFPFRQFFHNFFRTSLISLSTKFPCIV